MDDVTIASGMFIIVINMASGRPATSTNQAERHEESFPPLKRTRGGNLNWKQVAVHDSLEIALSHYSTERLIEKDLIKGKIAGTKTLVYNFSCGKKTCGCRKQYRLTTVQCAVEVIEEETFGEHENHDQYQRNNGRGLSYAQSSIVEDAIRNNLTKTQQVIDYFTAIAEEGVRREGTQTTFEFRRWS